jgi:hypothetical protein
MGDVPSDRRDPLKPSLLEQGAAIVQEQATDSVVGGAAVTQDAAEAHVSVKAGGDRWSVFAWAQWAKDKLTGRSSSSVGVGGEARWLKRR